MIHELRNNETNFFWNILKLWEFRTLSFNWLQRSVPQYFTYLSTWIVLVHKKYTGILYDVNEHELL